MTNNPLHYKVPVTEQLVGRLGRLIDVATCDVMLVQIPDELVGWQFCPWEPSLRLEAGWAHGSLEVPGAIERRIMRSRNADDNARRHASLYALYDWLVGEDPQWLECALLGGAYLSHDHGSYFPNGPGWTVDSLRKHGQRPRHLPFPTDGLDPGELLRLADRVSGITAEELSQVASALPASWPVEDGELEALVQFLLERRDATAVRLRAMIEPR